MTDKPIEEKMEQAMNSNETINSWREFGVDNAESSDMKRVWKAAIEWYKSQLTLPSIKEGATLYADSRFFPGLNHDIIEKAFLSGAEFQHIQSPSLPVEQGEVRQLIDKLIKLSPYHINPYNLGEMGEISSIIQRLAIIKTKPSHYNSNTRVIEYLKGKLNELDTNDVHDYYMRDEIKSWIKELEGKSNLQQ